MRFAEVVASSAAVAATRSRTAKISALADLLGRLDPGEIETAVGFLTGEPRQGRIGIGWATLAAVEVMPADTPTLTVHDVDAAVVSVARTSGAGSEAARRSQLAAVLARATAPEAEFVRRLFTGELRQGALDGFMLDAVARASEIEPVLVRRAAMRSGDLGATARLALAGGRAALEAVRFEVLRPVLPMLAGSSESVAAALESTGPASVEWKLDGARVQVHRSGSEVRIFTRNLNDVTARLPEVVELVLGLPASDLVLDGEAIGVSDDERPQRFQDTMSRFGRDTDSRHDDGRGTAAGRSLRAYFFDCLRAEGVDLLDEPLSARREVLTRIAPGCVVPSLVTEDPAAAEAFLAESLASGHEGVMVKALASTYEAGAARPGARSSRYARSISW